MNRSFIVTRRHSKTERLCICSAQMAKPTCAQSLELHSLQRGMPLEISTETSFCITWSRKSTRRSGTNSSRHIGVAEGSFSRELCSHTLKATTPSSTSLLRITIKPIQLWPRLCYERAFSLRPQLHF